MIPAEAEARTEFSAVDYLTGETFTVRRTPAGWWATTPVPGDMTRYYPEIYYGGPHGRFPTPVEWIQEQLYRRRAQWLTKSAGKIGRVLDVGCGPGHLLARLRALGWETLGTEATNESAAIPRENYQLEVRAGELSALNLEAHSYDAVVSWHTLEHMRDPLAVLDEFSRLLKPGGLLLISVPDFGSVEAQANPAAWFHLDVPRHLAHFPAGVLEAALIARSFTIEDKSFWAPEYDAFSLIQTWQNRLGLPHNLLYLMLKAERRPTGHPPHFGQQLFTLLLAFFLAPLAMLVSVWRAWRQTGAVVIFLARKRAA